MNTKNQRNGMSRKQYRESLKTEQKSVPSFDVKVNNGGKIVNDPNDNNLIVDTVLKNPRRLYEIAERSQPVNVAIDSIASIIASTPLLLKSKKTDDNIKDDGSSETIHPMVKPNPDQTLFDFLYTGTVSMLVEGGCRVFFGSGKREVMRVHECPAEYDADGNVIGYRWKSVFIDKKYVRNVGKPGYTDSKSFRSALKAAIDNVFLHSEASKTTLEHLRNGLIAKGLLINKNVDGLAAVQAQKSLKDFAAKESGTKGVKYLAPGWEFTQVSSTLVDSQVVQVFELGNIEVIRAFGLPESFYNNDAASFATASSQQVNFFKKTIMPLCAMWERALNDSGLAPKDKRFEFDLGELISAEEKKLESEMRVSWASAAVQLASLERFTDNEIRRAAGFDSAKDSKGNPIPQADINPIEIIEDEPEQTENQSPEDKEKADLEKENQDLAKMLEIEEGLFSTKDLRKNEN